MTQSLDVSSVNFEGGKGVSHRPEPEDAINSMLINDENGRKRRYPIFLRNIRSFWTSHESARMLFENVRKALKKKGFNQISRNNEKC